jgi:hypothetical protein
LAVLLDEGLALTVDMTETLRKGGVFTPLRDPAVFARVRIGDRRRTVEWSAPHLRHEQVIDIDAESLMHMAASRQGAEGRDDSVEMRKA